MIPQLPTPLHAREEEATASEAAVGAEEEEEEGTGKVTEVGAEVTPTPSIKDRITKAPLRTSTQNTSQRKNRKKFLYQKINHICGLTCRTVITQY